MPFKTVKRKGKLVNISVDTGNVHGTFPRTPGGHARAAAQMKILEESMKKEGKRKKK